MKSSGTVTEGAWVRVEWNSYSVAGLFFIIYKLKHVKDQINTLDIEIELNISTISTSNFYELFAQACSKNSSYIRKIAKEKISETIT